MISRKRIKLYLLERKFGSYFSFPLVLAFVFIFPVLIFTSINLNATLPEGLDIKADELSFTQDSNILVGKGNVRIVHKDIVILTDKIQLNTTTLDIFSSGNTQFQQGEFVWIGDNVNGNLNSNTFELGQYKTKSNPWFGIGSNIQIEQSREVKGENIKLSTCEYLHENKAHWRMEAKKILYYPDGKFKAYDVVHKIGGIPIFYSPVIAGKANQTSGNFHFSTGYKSDFGAILTIARDWETKKNIKTQFGSTYHSKRGTAFFNNTDISTQHGLTDLLLYGMHDNDPLFDSKVGGEKFNGRFKSTTDRYRIKLQHQTSFKNNIKFMVDADYLSDYDFLLEFYKREFYKNAQPVSSLELGYYGNNAEVTVNYRPRLNDFESTVERLPEVRLDLPRQQIKNSNLYYKGESSIAKLKMNWREYDLLRVADLAELKDYETERFDSLNLLYFPFKLNFINIVPRLGARFTFYSDSSKSGVTQKQLDRNFQIDDPKATINDPFNATNYDNNGGQQSRFTYELGMEASVKIASEWTQNKRNENQPELKRHIIRPFINYTFIPRTNVNKDNLFFFDEVDRLEKTNFVRIGTRHSFQKKSNDRISNISKMENFFDFYFSPEDNANKPGDFGTIFEVYQSDSLSLLSKFLLDTNRGDINVMSVGSSMGKKDGSKLDFSYLYRQSFTSRYSYSMGSELTQIQTPSFMPTSFFTNHSLHVNCTLPLTQKSSLRVQYYFDLDREAIARQTYELTRDLHCWVGSIGIEQNENDFAVYFLFYLKDFPKFKIDIGS